MTYKNNTIRPKARGKQIVNTILNIWPKLGTQKELIFYRTGQGLHGRAKFSRFLAKL
mgnify:CR=1 FL=1